MTNEPTPSEATTVTNDWRRCLACALAIVLLAAASCEEDDPPEPGPDTPTPAPAPDPAPPPTASPVADCVLQAIVDGVPGDQIDRRCELQAQIEDLLLDLQVRESIAAEFNAVRPGWDVDLVAEWEHYTCENGAPAINDLVNQVNVGNAPAILLLRPLTDFVALAADGCANAPPGLLDDLTAAAWSTVMGPQPTPEEIRVTLTDDNSEALVSQNLFQGAKNLCDVVGNGGVAILERLSSTDFPKWADLALGFAIGQGCQQVLS